MADSCCHSGSSHDHGKYSAEKPFRLHLLPLASAASALLIGASFFIPLLEAFRRTYLHYASLMIVPLAAGLVLGGLMDHWVPRTYISKMLARKKKRTILYAVGMGFLMSGCSHGILALSMELYRKGASGPAVASLLLASPWANITITILLIGFFGWKAFVIIGAALLVAVITGLVFQALDRKGWIEHNPHTLVTDAGFSIRGDIARRIKAYRFSWKSFGGDMAGIMRGIRMLAGMVLGWVLLGMLLASLAGAFIPQHFFQQYLGDSLRGLLVTLFFATVIEVCSEGSSPLAFEIYRQTAAFGNAFVFLMAGVVTDYTEIGLIWSNIGRRTALWLILVTVPQVLLLGWIFNRVF